MQKEALKELARGRPIGAVCQKYDVAPKTLQEWKRKVSLNEGSPGPRGRPGREISDDQKLAIAEAYQKGTKQMDIMAEHKLYNRQLYTILKELGIPLRPNGRRKTSNVSVLQTEKKTVSVKREQSESIMELADVQADEAEHPLHQYISKEVIRAMEVRLLRNENATLREMYCELKVENMELQRRIKKGK